MDRERSRRNIRPRGVRIRNLRNREGVTVRLKTPLLGARAEVPQFAPLGELGVNSNRVTLLKRTPLGEKFQVDDLISRF